MRSCLRYSFSGKRPILMLAAGAAVGAVSGYGARVDKKIDADAVFLGMLAICAAVSVIIGRENACGGYKNKIMTGAGRLSVYIAAIVSSLAVMKAMFAVMTAVSAVINTDIFVKMSDPKFGYCYAAAYLQFLVLFYIVNASAAVTAAAVAVNLPSRAAYAAGIVLIIALVSLTEALGGALREPEYDYDPEAAAAWDILNENEMERNPKYIDGGLRDVCNVVYCALPTGAMTELCYEVRPTLIVPGAHGIILEPVYMYSFVTRPFPEYVLGVLCKPLFSAAAAVLGFAVFGKKEF